jgi:DNA-binding MarR family transcriptional regulator
MNEISTSSAVHEMNIVMNRIAEYILQDKAGVSYARFAFLFTVKQHSAVTQHRIAQAMKVSDPAVSKLCAEAAREGLVHITINPQHKRQRLIRLTANGKSILQHSLTLLDTCFGEACMQADINEKAYGQQTARLLNSLNNKYKEITQ